MHLSRVIFQPPRRARERFDPYRVHQLLWKAFPGVPPGRRPFLFRAHIEQFDYEGPRLVCLVQSEIRGEWKRVGSALENFQEKPFEPRFQAGQRLKFFLRANPTRARKDINEPKYKGLTGPARRKVRGRRVGIVRSEEQIAWLERKAKCSGFELEGVLITQARPWRWRAKGHSIRHDGADFQGQLCVQDREQFLSVVRSGIGPAKALGFGLLSLAKAW